MSWNWGRLEGCAKISGAAAAASTALPEVHTKLAEMRRLRSFFIMGFSAFSAQFSAVAESRWLIAERLIKCSGLVLHGYFGNITGMLKKSPRGKAEKTYIFRGLLQYGFGPAG